MKNGVRSYFGSNKNPAQNFAIDVKSNEKDAIEKMILDIKEDKTGYELSAKEKRTLLRRLEERKKKLEVIEVTKATAKQAMEEIQRIVDRESTEGNIVNRVKYLETIKGALCGKGKKSILSGIEISEESKKYLLELIDIDINEEKTRLYYDQVMNFTNGFQFLSEYPEIIKATSGFTSRKFTDREAYDRFCTLRTSLQDGFSEYSQINRLLSKPNLDNGDKRILEARKRVMDKQIERKREMEGR